MITINDKIYIEMVEGIAYANGISVDLVDSELIYPTGETSPVAGFFCAEERRLCVATRRSFCSWFPIFVHESCHMQQYLENCESWSNLDIGIVNTDACGLLFDWLEHRIELHANDVAAYCRAVQMLELDCEKRSVRNILDWQLTVDLDEYVRGANAYVMFYNYVRKHRKWTKEKSVYDPILACNFEPKFYADHEYHNMPHWYEDAVTKHCFSE